MEALRRSGKKKKKKQGKSGVRTKFLIESLRNEYNSLKEENEKLRDIVSGNMPSAAAQQVLSQCYDVNATTKAGVNDVDRLAGEVADADLLDDDDDDEDE